MKLYQLIFTENDCYKAGEKIKPKGIMVHSTAANNPELRRYVGPDDGRLGVNIYGNHWNQPMPKSDRKCVHAFIGKLKDGSIATYQVLPWDHLAWHCAGDANNTHISFEICEDGLTGRVYFDKVYQEAVELCAYLCQMYGLSEKDIIDHSEGAKKGIASGHSDVSHWFPKHGKNMDTFRAAVKAKLAKPQEVEKEQEEKPEEKHLYRVRKAWEDKASQIGAYNNLKYAIDAAVEGYCVFDENGKQVYPATTDAPLLDDIESPSDGQTCTVVMPVLRRGSSGGYVKTLQILLNAYRNAGLGVDGVFGAITEKAVKAYKKSHGLAINDIVDEIMWSKLLM